MVKTTTKAINLRLPNAQFSVKFCADDLHTWATVAGRNGVQKIPTDSTRFDELRPLTGSDVNVGSLIGWPGNSGPLAVFWDWD